MKRRLFSLFLALTLVVGMLPAPAFAQETEPTQVTEAPTEAPATEAPATEAPATEAPATEAPATEAPAAEPTPAPTEAPVPETTVAPASTEVPAEPASTEDEAVAAVQAMIDALPDVDHMSEEYIDALEEAYSAYETLSESQQAQITGVEKLEALFNWVNSQVSTLAEDVKEISGKETWNNQTITTPVKLTGDTTLTLTGTNRIECDQPLDLNGFDLTIKGTGTLEVVGDGRSKKYQCNGAIFDSTYTGGTASAGTLILESGTVKASGGTHNAISLYAVDLKGGKLEAYGGVRSGLACSYLYARSGSIYATGGKYGIYAAVFRGAFNPGNLPILASDEKNASMAEMDEGNLDDINDNAYKKTYYIGDVTGPMLSVKAQKGYLYEGVAAQKATFAISHKNVNTDTLNAQWVGDHTGLTASLTADDKSLWVTTNSDVKQGTYNLTVTVTGTDGTPVTKTVTVNVLGAPITVTTQPKDASASCKGGDLDAWQGDKEIQVTATRAEGLTEDITYQWKLEDDTVLDGFNQPTLSLKELYNDNAGKLTPVVGKSWLLSAQVYCTLTVGSYSVNTNAVTLTVNTCAHERANPDGTCQKCGEPCSSVPLLVSERGTYHVVDTSESGTAQVGGFLTGGGIFYLTADVLTRDINAGNTMAGSVDVTLDLQKHTLESLNMGNFPYGSFTLKDGTLNQCVYSTATEGKLILDGVTFGDACWQAANNDFLDITVRGNTVFQANVSFSSYEDVVHLQGGTFQKGINVTTGEEALALLDDGYAFRNKRGIVDASIPENLGGEIQVVAHTCKYVNGKCECGRSCDHAGKVGDDGYCTVCHALVKPYAIGEVWYTSLKAALDAANAGDTITLRGNFYQGAATVEINKPVTLDLGGHTLTSDADDAPVLRVLAENVTIRNGTVENTRTAKSSPAVMVGKFDATGMMLTVKNVNFIGSITAVTPRASALSVQPSNVAKVENGTFTGGIYVEGSLTMTGGSATSLELGSSQGKAELSGGTFDSINPGNADYAALLVEGYAYQANGQLVKPENMADGIAVEVVKCGHPDGLTDTEACAYCGLTCAHSTVNAETGLCQECGSQVYEANVTAADGSVTGYRTLEDALSNGRNATVKLLADCKRGTTFHVTVPLTLDLNGKRMEGSSGLIVHEGPTTILDSSPAKTGTIAGTSNWKYSGMGLSVYNNANVTLTILGGHFEGKTDGLRLVGQNTLILKGGSFSSIHITEGATATLWDALAPGYAYYKDADNTLYDPGDDQGVTVGLHVGAHTEHTPDSSGHCHCGYTAAAMLDTEAGKQYFADFSAAVTAAQSASGSTLTLLRDVTYSGDSGIYIDRGTFTIDWNGHTLTGSFWGNLLTISGPANVTLTDSSGNNTGGARQTGKGAAVLIAVGSEGIAKIQGGTYSPNVTRAERCYGSVRISGGVFENPHGYGQNYALYDLGDRPLSQMLADGTAFAYEADGSDPLNAYNANQSDSFRTVYAVPHTHEIFDENGVCTCGYPCPHENWTDGVCDLCGCECTHPEYTDGVCDTCGHICEHENVTDNDGVYSCDDCHLTMTVMVETADGNVSYTTDLAAALNDAEDGTTVTLLGDVSLEKNADIIGGNKTVTLDMNGHNIAQNGDLCIGGESSSNAGKPAKLIIKGSGDLPRAVNVFASGKLDLSDWTGTVAYVNLANICDFVGPTGDGHLGELNISNWRNGNQGTILLQGGTIGQLWLNSFEDFQIILGSLLESGYAVKSGSEFLPYDRAIVYSYSGTSDNILNDLTIVPCPHTGLDSSGRCTYCGATGFVATVTKNGVTAGYTDFLSALDEICDGKRGTLKLLTDVSENGQYVYRISGTLDLNGKNLAGKLVCAQGSNLQIVNRGSDMSKMGKLEVWNGAKVTIADTAASINFSKVTVESGSLANLLPEGGAYFRTDRQTWIPVAEAATKRTLENVAVKEVPVKSVTLTANKTSVPYGESQTVTLTASATLSGDATASYDWAELMSYGPVPMGEDEASFTLPAGVNVGSHIYEVSVTAGSYTLSEVIEITVTKAKGTLVNKDYPTQFTYGDTVPTPKAENFITNNPDGTFSYYWETESGTMLEADANPISAGTYTLHVEVASSGNYETVQKSFPVTVSPLEITDENIAYDLGEDLIYNGKSQKAAFRSITANGMPLNYTLTGNTATDAGSYTMTVTGQGSFTGSVEIPWEIQPRSLTNANVTLGDSLTYNGREQPQTVASVTVEGMDRALTEGVDFQVSGNTGTNAGDYMLTVESASGNFIGSADRPWSIAPLDISKASKVIIDHDPLTYNGKPQTPTNVSITADGLNVTVDVTVTPQTDAGRHGMTVTGKGNFTGSTEASWYIDPKSIEDATVNLDKQLTYNGQEQTQNVSVVIVDGIEGALVKGVDFGITGNTGTDAGDYTMTIVGSGNYTGSKDVSWSIDPKDIVDAKITLGDSLTYNFEEQTQTIASVTVDGLNVPTYTVIDNTGTDAKDYTLTVIADGNFTGTQTAKWNIAPMDISNERVLIQSNDVSRGLIYNGEEQTPNIALAQVLNAEAKKYLAITFQVDVTPQVNVGRYTLGIIGTGNFTGRKDGFTWKINPKDMSNAEVVLGDSLTYNGQEQIQTIRSVTVDGLSVDYTVTGNVGLDAQGYVLTVTGSGNFTGRKYVPWAIARKDIANAKITLGDSLTYNFEKQTQTIASVTVGGLDVPTYGVTGHTGTDAGEYTLTVRGNGNFTGTQTAKWNIAPLDINTGAMFAYFDNLTYNGEAQTPKVVKVELQIGAKTMEITYDVDVTPQVNVGKYPLTIIGTGNFTGRKDGFTWKINPKDMSNAEVVLGDSLTYNGQEQTQTITSVTVDGISSALIEGVDYIVNGNTRTDADRYDIYLRGIGNFTGTWHDEWEIAKKDVTIENTAVESSKVYDGTTAAKITNTGTLSANYDGDGVQIVSGTAAYDNKNVGTGKTVTFTGFSLTGDRARNYRLVSQPASVTADITAKEITLTVSVKDKVFDGTTKAELDTVTHTDFVAGDDVELVNGEPSFAYPCVRADIPIRFTDFRLTGSDAGNYQLTNAQPEGVTAEIHPTPNYLDVTNKPEFDGKTTVTVDGVEYPIEETGERRYVNLPETGDLLTIYSFKDGTPEGSYTNYPTGMQVFRITRQEGGATAEEITEFANLLNYAGCSIRLTGTKGIRMITGISETKRTALIGAQGLAGYTLEEYGTVVMRGVGTPTLENSKSHNFAYKKGKADPVFARVGGMIQYTNVLVGFGLEDCKDTLTLRPYIILKDMTTGETITLYGGCVSRSIGYIARQNANTYQPGTAGYKYIHEIIDAVYGKTEQGGETK